MSRSCRVIAHRGAAAEAAENTIEAFDLALRLGADALELDVQPAGDGTLVVIHDPTLERTTEGSGAVAEHGAVELGRLGVPSLEEVLRRYPGIEITVDVKHAPAAADVVALVDRLGRTDLTILYVEEGTELDAFRGYRGRRATSTRQAAHLADAVASGRAPALLSADFPEVVHTPLAGPGGAIVTAGLVADVRRSGRTIQVWTIDRPDEMSRLRQYGVDGIITNDVRTAVGLPSAVAEGQEAGPTASEGKRLNG